MGKRNRVYVKTDGLRKSPVVKRNTRPLDIGMIISPAAVMVVPFSWHFIFPLLVFIVTMSLMSWGVFRAIPQVEEEREFNERLQRFAAHHITGETIVMNNASTLINAVMNCSHGTIVWKTNNDEDGNCPKCKKEYLAIANQEVNDYVHYKLEKAIKKVEKKERKRAFESKKKELNLHLNKHHNYANALDPKNIPQLREAKYTIQALHEIDQGTLNKDRKRHGSALLPTGVELINPEAKQWEESFKEHAGEEYQDSQDSEGKGISRLFSFLAEKTGRA